MGVYIKSNDKEFRKSDSRPKRHGNSNNVAEYLAVIMLLKLLKNKRGCIINIYGDSKMVVRQLNGTWRALNGYYIGYARQAKELYDELLKHNTIRISWIPREKNWEADKLSKAD